MFVFNIVTISQIQQMTIERGVNIFRSIFEPA